MTYGRVVHLAYDHVIFDLDGTLVDSRTDLSRAVNHALRTLRLPELAAQTIWGYIGEGARVLVHRALGGAHADHLEEALVLFLNFYAAHLLDATRPYPGVVEMLSGLRTRGVALSVLTNKPVAMSRAILEGLGLLSSFITVLGGDSLPTRKPDPSGVEYLRGLTQTAPDRTLLVGDSLIDLRTAGAAGVAFCGVAWGQMPDALRAAVPADIIAYPLDLLAVVERR